MTDPDAPSMATKQKRLRHGELQRPASRRHKHHLIVEHEVTNFGNDLGQLSRMATSAKEAMGKPKLKVVADRGYFSGPEIRACDLNDISAYVPNALPPSSRKNGSFTETDFVYVARNDAYRRPPGKRAILRCTTVKYDMNLRAYRPFACRHCPMKDRCSLNDYRRIRRRENENIPGAMQRRLDRKPDVLTRRNTVEHVFGTLKHRMDPAHFLTGKLGRVSTKTSFLVLAHNLKQVMNIPGVAGAMKAMKMTGS